MPLRIGFDLDGVLADMEAELVRQAEAIFGKAMTRRLEPDRAAGADPPPPASGNTTDAKSDSPPPADRPPDDVPPLLKLQLSSRQQRRLWRHVETITNFWETLEELEPGMIQRIGAMAAERRWEIIFLTKRPASAGATAQMQTQRWLESKGFRLPSVFVVQGSRGRIAAALGLDVVIDDRPENCLDVVVDSSARAILVWRDEEKLLPVAAKRLGIDVVKTVSECLEILGHMQTAVHEQPGVVGRVMRLLGRKETASV
jgi:hypothetical protein